MLVRVMPMSYILVNALILDYQIYQRGSIIHHFESHHVLFLISETEIVQA
jgi:hypothetical protein